MRLLLLFTVATSSLLVWAQDAEIAEDPSGALELPADGLVEPDLPEATADDPLDDLEVPDSDLEERSTSNNSTCPSPWLQWALAPFKNNPLAQELCAKVESGTYQPNKYKHRKYTDLNPLIAQDVNIFCACICANSTAPGAPNPNNGTNTTTPAPSPNNGTNTTTPAPSPNNGTNTTSPAPNPNNGTNTTAPAPNNGTNTTAPHNGTNSTTPTNGTCPAYNSTTNCTGNGTNCTIPAPHPNCTNSTTGTSPKKTSRSLFRRALKAYREWVSDEPSPEESVHRPVSVLDGEEPRQRMGGAVIQTAARKSVIAVKVEMPDGAEIRIEVPDIKVAVR